MDRLDVTLIQDFLQRNNIIIEKVLSSKVLSQGDLAGHLNEINHALDSKLSIEDQQLYLSDKDREKCYRYLKQHNHTLFTYYVADYRRVLLFLHLSLSEADLNLQELADQLLVSKNTALADVKRLKKELESNGIFLKYSRKTGYTLLGSEFVIRNELVNTLKQVLKQPSGKYFLLETGFIQEYELVVLKKRLTHLQQQAQVTFTEESFEELPLILECLIRRSQLFAKTWHFKFEKYDIKNTKEFPMYAKIFKHISGLNENDLLYLVLQIMSATMIKSNLDLSESEEIFRATDRFITFLEEECVMQFCSREGLKEKLLLHLRPAIYRCLLCINIKNPLTDVFIEEYRPLYLKIEEGIRIFEQLIGRTLPKEEVVFIAMIVISSMTQTAVEAEEPVFKAMVLCRSGMSISKLLLENLRAMFPKIEFVGAYAIHDVSQRGIEPDFLFTTIPIHTEITTILVPPVLDKEARERIRNQVEVAINQDVTKKTKELFGYLSDLFPEFCKEDAYTRIEHFYAKNDRQEMAVEEDYFRLSVEHIGITEGAGLSEVLTQVFQPMVDRGSVTTEYVQVCREIFLQDFQYMMIAYECYLPHAKPEFGVMRPDYQILLIKDGIQLPNGDVLKVLVALAPSAGNQHVEWLLNINQLFLEDGVQRRLRDVNTEQSFFSLLEEGFERIS